MKVGYYPGCSLESTAAEYNESLKEICSMLDIQLNEIRDWNCCGATSAHCLDEKASFLLAARNLEIAEKTGMDLVVPCSGCFSRLKFAEKNALSNEKYKGMSTFRGSINIIDMTALLSGSTVLEAMEKKLVKPLKGMKIAAYYGCMSLRPPKITDAPDHDNPQSMEKILAALGAEIIPWTFKTFCCGGSLAITRTDIVRDQVNRILDMAAESGAECLVTSCPMCQSNLDTREDEVSRQFSREIYIPIFYFSELIGLALGSGNAGSWFMKHQVDPRKLLSEKGL